MHIIVIGLCDGSHIVYQNEEDIVKNNEHIDMNFENIYNFHFQCVNTIQNFFTSYYK